MKKIIVSLSVVSILMCMCRFGYAQQNVSAAPRTISYQGYLVDDAKKTLTGNHTITIKLYDAPNEGALLHTESFVTPLQSGVFSVMIGSVIPLEATLHFDRQYWLGISVDNAGELSPRTALAAVPYAIHADAASSLAKGGSGAVTTFNGRSGDLILKGGAGTQIQENGNTFTISAAPTLNGGEQTQTTTVNSITGTNNQVLANGTSGQKQSGDVTLTLPQNIHTNASPTFNGMTLQNFGNSGVVHNNSSGNLSSSLIGNADIGGNANIAYSKLNLTGNIINSDIAAGANINSSKLNLNNAITSGDIAAGTIMNSDINAGANISDTKLATISAAGKVSNSATTATPNNTAHAIVHRDASGNFSAGTITATLNGNATNVTGTVQETNGGTGTASYNKGDILYASSANSLSKRAIGNTGQVLVVNNNGVPSWSALSGVGVTSMTGTVNQVLVNGTSGIQTTGGITLTLPQDIYTGASPTFAGLTLSGKGASALTLATDPTGTLATKSYVDNIATGYWSITGNTGLTSATNYFGTNDAANLSFKTNGIQRLMLTSDGSMLLSGTTGSVPASGAGTRMMWIPSLGAFRAGVSAGSEWDSINLGAQSVGMGFGAYASGAQSVAMGYFTNATAAGAVAIGYGVTASQTGAIALGSGGSNAMGIASVALGYGTTAVGISSIAMGEQTMSTGDRSFAQGYNSESFGSYSFASGKNIKVGASSFGFNGSTTNSTMDVSSNNNIAYFGDVNMIIGNDDNSARSLMFYESNNIANLSGAFYTAFTAQTQAGNISYLLPASQGVANSLMTNNGSGTMSWSSLASLGVPSFSGTANNLAFWTSSSALGSSSSLYYNSSTNRLGIGVSSPTQALDVSGNVNVSGTITSASGITTNGIAMSGGTAVFSYATISAGATITIPNNTVVKINDDGANAANAVTMPSGTNGQIIYIYNNDAQTTTGSITLATGAMGVFIYVDGWRKAN